MSIAANLILTLAFAAQDSPELAHFERNVRPLLVEHCLECHTGPRPKGGLDLSTRGGWELGGDSGPALVPGDVTASLLVRAVRYEESDLRMPPNGRLSDGEIATLVEWVRSGAHDPRDDAGVRQESTLDLAAAREHWAFQPVSDPAPPTVNDEAWVRTDIDRFVLARLEHEGLSPAPEASKHTWLRRVGYDLVGLPPSEAELAAFLADEAPDAHERVVERLLASPHYGERQARRWLDLARYADSNGVDENVALANAWRYRDWVVKAFNEDLPYDRFVVQQLAGDLLPPADDESETFDAWTATGFLVLGPKMLAEQDKEKLVLDVVDEQLDVAGQAFLGLTIGCARCHDHKFDPISHEDYHALAGVFRSTETLSSLDHVSRWREAELASAHELEARAAWQVRAQELDASLAALEASATTGLVDAWRADVAAYLLAAGETQALVVQAEDFSRSNLAIDRSHYGNERTGVVHTSKPGLQFAEYDLVVPSGGAHRLEVRYAAQDSRPMRVLVNGSVVHDEAFAATTGGWRVDAQAWHEGLDVELAPGRNVLRLERPVDVPHLDVLLLRPVAAAEAAGLAPAVLRNWIVELASTRADDPLLGAWRALGNLDDARFAAEALERIAALRSDSASPASDVLLGGLAPASRRELAGRYQTVFAVAARVRDAADPVLVRARELLFSGHGPFALASAELEALLPPERAAALAAARTERATHEASRPEPFARVLAVADSDVHELPIHARGSHLALVGEPVPRGVPDVFDGLVPAPDMPAETSGRLELARWITHPEHPLTSRVAVNRVWQGSFGRGLVASASNFGLRGDAPTHPELLDFLAREFVRRGWSTKALHRELVLSSTYRQSSERVVEALERDPANTLLAGFPRRRLEAEELRDTLLFVAGKLDARMGGTLLETANADYVTNDQSGDAARYDAPRRSLYLSIVRNSIYDLFATFDYADPSVPIERRSRTTVAHQVLALLNSPLALQASVDFAGELLSPAPDDDRARLERAYLRAFGRRPEPHEATRLLAWLGETQQLVAEPREELVEAAPRAGGAPAAPPPSDAARRDAWEALCQVLLASNELLHVE